MIELITAVFATYRIARMLAFEEGAFGILERVRNSIDPEQATWLGRGLNCDKCIGFWVSLIIACLLPFVSWQMFIITWLGIAGAAVALGLVVERGDV
jgi:uncharacterized membrane protein